MIRFGLIGCGGIAAWHIAAIRALPEGTLTAVCDANPAAAQKTAEEQNAAVFSGAQELLASGIVDAAVICTPSGSHASLAMAALEAGVIAIVEKPMAITPESLKQLLEAEQKSSAFLCPISQLRFLPDVQKVKQWMDEKALGKLVLADLSMKYWRSNDYYTAKPWRGTWEHDGGGALMNQGIHGLDLLRYLCGTPRCLAADGSTQYHPIETEDTLAVCLQFPGGAKGVVTAATTAFPGFPRRLELCGDHGSLTLEEGTLVACSLPGAVVSKSRYGGHDNPESIDFLPHQLQYRNIADAILRRAPLAVTAQDMAQTLELIFEIYRKAGLIPNE